MRTLGYNRSQTKIVKTLYCKIYKEIGEIKKIDRNVVEKLVDKMIVSKEGGVEIQWTFKEIFNSA